MNFASFIQKIPSIEFVLKRLELILIDFAIKDHKKQVIYSRMPSEISQYLKEFNQIQTQQLINKKRLNVKSIYFKGSNRYIFSFKSPFNPLKTFEAEFKAAPELHLAKISYYPHKSKNKKGKRKAIIYLHGWGKNTLRVEEIWHFPILKQAYNADIFALELPYHMSRNPGGFSGQGFLDADPIRTIEAFRQSMAECICIYNSLISIYENVGIVGISLGGHIATYTSLFLNKDIFILCCLVGTPFSQNLKNLQISPNLVKSLSQKDLQTHQAIKALDFTNIPLKKKNKLLFLFGGKYDSVIDSVSVKNLGKHLQCETQIVPTGHFTFAFSLPYITHKNKW